MAAALLSLGGFFISLYLWLWKLGMVGELACGAGGQCEVVQNSSYAVIFGLPVAAYGVFGYAALLAVSLAGLQPRWQSRREPTLLLLALAAGGVAFTAYLTYLEAFVIRAWCRWCLVSAAIIVAILVSAFAGLRELRRAGSQS
ncbi:MAG: hypothetical protein KatS3mg081_2052 [Gemmatimonadales bacterium]|nr:MAG: hypothetical protein KatS3mg081_2052 [Gemmatimonadales bacterium]